MRETVRPKLNLLTVVERVNRHEAIYFFLRNKLSVQRGKRAEMVVNRA